jgi:hypothetical protein
MIKKPTFEEYDEYIYDYDTSNASFIAMASLLYRKGVKNYNFFLKLYDEDLVGVDPYDEDLDTQTKMKILMECRRNFWYFIREVMIIPGTGKFKLNRGNLAGAWALVHNIPMYLVLPRQIGKTWLVISFALWTFNFASNYSNMIFMNKQFNDSKLNLKRFKDARSELPPYLRLDKIPNDRGELKDGTSNVQTIANALHNEITAKASARNPISADELGRGMNVPWFWIDELAFVQFIDIIYSALYPAWSKAAEIARGKNKPVARILTTTPGDLSTPTGSWAFKLRNEAAQFNESMYDINDEDLGEYMEKSSGNGYLYIEFHYQQLGKTEAWFKEQCKGMNYDWAKIRREFLLQWNNATSNSPFDEDDLRELRSMMLNEDDDLSFTINKYYRLNVYRPLDKAEKYIVVVDR